MEEIWKPIYGFEGMYEISNFSRVKSLDRFKINRWGQRQLIKGRILKQRIDKDGYSRIGLYKNGKYYCFGAHRLVAEAFIPNPNNLPCVNHKDENKLNNFVYVNPDGTVDFEKSNLEWCTNSYNLNYGHRLEKAIEKRKIHILQFTKNMDFVGYYDSLTEAANSVNGLASNICSCCKQNIKSAYNYVWRYAD